jgi:predicted CopG family antitoxin
MQKVEYEMKVIRLDENAYRILAEEKQRLRNQGQNASFSDAVRSLAGKIRGKQEGDNLK